MKRAVVSIGALLALAGCSRWPAVEDTWRRDLHGDFEERARQAPLVVAGVVEGTETGAERNALRDPSVRLRLARTTIRIENVLKGEPAADRLDFVYFQPVLERLWAGTPAPFLPQTGERRIFFLRREGGAWRAIGDYWDHSIPVWSGAHAQDAADPRRPLGQAIAGLLLTAGRREFDRARFLEALPRSAAVARAFAARWYAMQLLRGLAGASATDPELAAAACRVLAVEFDYGDECLDRLPLAADFLDGQRWREEERFERLVEIDWGGLQALAGSGHWRDIHEELKLWAVERDYRVRRAACRVLAEKYADAEPVVGCQ